MALSSGVYNGYSEGAKFLKKQLWDGRQEYDTIADMKAVKDMQMPEMIIGFCHEDHCIYLFNKQNTKDDILGKWRPLSVDVELNVKFEDVNVEDAEINVLYVVGEDIKYTKNNSIWIYMNPEFKTHKILLPDVITFNSEDTSFDLSDELEGLEFELYINGVRNFEGHDYEVDRAVIPNRITFDTVYDVYDTCNISYYGEQMIRQIELANHLVSKSFFDKYYEKYPGQTLIISDTGEIDEDLYIPLGNYESDVLPTRIAVNSFVYDNQPKEIQIGVDSKLVAKVWLVKNNMFYVCAPLLAIITAMKEQTIFYLRDSVYRVTNKTIINNNLEIASVCTVNDQTGYTHQVNVVSPNYVQFRTGHGSQGIGIVLKDDTHNLLNRNDIIYRINQDTGNLGVRSPSEEYGTLVSYARYPNLNDGQPYTASKTYKLPNVLYVLDKGTVEVDIEVYEVVD